MEIHKWYKSGLFSPRDLVYQHCVCVCMCVCVCVHVHVHVCYAYK